MLAVSSDLLPGGAHAQTVVPDSQSQIVVDKQKAELVGAGGEYDDSFDFILPEFRSLQPKLGLRYNSALSNRGGVQNSVAYGWQLTGLPHIERQSVGGGVPTFDDGQDIYLLDGQELMACEDAAATNKWSASAGLYPDRYKTTVANASCSAGGNFSTRIESYRKIIFTNNQFTVTEPDGTRFVFRSPAAIIGDTSVSPSVNWKLGNRLFWYLTEITDSQTDTNGNYLNQVSIGYSVGAFADGVPAVPTSITYAGYVVQLGYKTASSPVSTFGTGTGNLGQLFAQLQYVAIYDGANPIRAYALTITNSALTNTRLLTKVETFGSDFTVNAALPGGIAGTKLPDVTFEYSGDAYSTLTTTYAGNPIHSHNAVVDLSSSGRDELLLYPESLYYSKLTGTQNNGSVSTALFATLPGAHYSFGTDRSLTASAGISNPCEEFNGYQQPDGIGVQVRVFANTRLNARNVCKKESTTSRWVGGSNNGYEQYTYTWHTADLITGQVLSSGSTVGSSPTTWYKTTSDFDYDRDPELVHVSTYGGTPSYSSYSELAQGTVGASVSLGVLAGLREDVTGDLVDDDVTPTFLPGTAPKYTIAIKRVLPEAMSVNGTARSKGFAYQLGTGTVNLPSGTTTTTLGLTYFADMNGDGIADFVEYKDNTTSDTIAISSGSGVGFGTRQVFNVGNIVVPYDSAAIYFVDVNADGLNDVIVHRGMSPLVRNTPSSTPPATPYTSKPATILLNTGSGFISQGATSGGLAAIGDFDGDGLKDFALEGANGSVAFGNSGVPNLLIAVNNAQGGRTEITYAASAQQVQGQYSNQIPIVQQVVSRIVVKDGLGGSRSVAYTYTNGTYDFINRRPLGYTTVAAQLDPIGSEAAGPVITTTYANSNFVDAGHIKSRIVSVGGTTTWSQEYNNWSLTGSPTTLSANTAPESGGPFAYVKTDSRFATSYSGVLEETTQAYTYTPYGEPATVIDYGMTVAGVDQAAGDNTVTTIAYQPNLTAYIVGKPKSQVVQTGTVSNATLATWLRAQYFVYDGAANESVAPTKGNLTELRQWDGVTTGTATRTLRSFTYDAFGNVLTERDTRGAQATTPYDVATHTYDATKNLFRLTTTNALAQVTSTTWNAACQKPLTVTDVNGLVTTMTYDVHCRETRKDLPNTPTAQYEITRYQNIGTPGSQYIEKETRSGTSVVGSTIRLARSYFDGLGRVYKVAKPGSTSAQADMIVELRAYDGRGNLAWKSIPLSWAASTGNTATASQRETYAYDPLDRLTQTTYADGAYDTKTYTTASFDVYGTALTYPGVKSSNADCYDAVAANTVCGELTEFFDHAGRKVRELRTDAAATDVTGLATPDRVTQFKYDLIGQLKTVIDPEGLTFSYTYDAWGNRTQAVDPGLGTWTMTYDANNNLASQTDAKSQPITFTYDKLNRVTLKTVGTGTTRVETAYTYDQVVATYFNKGRVTQMAASVGGAAAYHTIQLDYDEFGSVERTRHTLDGKTYTLTNDFQPDGSVKRVSLPSTPGATTSAYLPEFIQDAAGRSVSWSGYINNTTYDLWSNPTQVSFAYGSSVAMSYSATRGWVTAIDGTEKTGTSTYAPLFHDGYIRSASGRIQAKDTTFTIGATTYDKESSFSYTYDYAGRLLAANNTQGVAGWTQTFSYDAAGRMRNNSLVGAYAYGNATVAKHAPSTVTPSGQSAQTLVYDGNGNQTTGLDGKVMTYDGENRPTSVTIQPANTRTCYIYGADGARLKKIEGFDGATACSTTPTTAQRVTLYLGPVEIRKYGQGNNEAIQLYPHPAIRIQLTKNAGGTVVTTLGALFTDAQGSVRAVTRGTGAKAQRSVFHPYGEEQTTDFDLTLQNETKGFIGQRLDADAGLLYLNARYYDPKLGMFLQPDWWEVTKTGVGTNRYGYSGGDPVNGSDPGGHKTKVTVDSKVTKDKNGKEVDGKITIKIDAAFKPGKRGKLGISDDEIIDAVQRTYSGTFEGVTVKGKTGTYEVETSISIVPEGKSDYLIDVSDGAGKVKVEVTGHQDGTKVMHLDSTTNLGSIVHEIGHFAGMKDHYSNTTTDGVTRAIPDPGWVGNVMADPKVLGSISQDQYPDAIIDNRNIDEVLAAPNYHSPEGGFAVRNGVSVSWQ
jgi:RHS repeat-associated protein